MVHQIQWSHPAQFYPSYYQVKKWFCEISIIFSRMLNLWISKFKIVFFNSFIIVSELVVKDFYKIMETDFSLDNEYVWNLIVVFRKNSLEKIFTSSKWSRIWSPRNLGWKCFPIEDSSSLLKLIFGSNFDVQWRSYTYVHVIF